MLQASAHVALHDMPAQCRQRLRGTFSIDLVSEKMLSCWLHAHLPLQDRKLGERSPLAAAQQHHPAAAAIHDKALTCSSRVANSARSITTRPTGSRLRPPPASSTFSTSHFLAYTPCASCLSTNIKLRGTSCSSLFDAAAGLVLAAAGQHVQNQPFSRVQALRVLLAMLGTCFGHKTARNCWWCSPIRRGPIRAPLAFSTRGLAISRLGFFTQPFCKQVAAAVLRPPAQREHGIPACSVPAHAPSVPVPEGSQEL